MAQKFFIRSDTLIKAENTRDAETGLNINDATVTMSLCDGTKKHLDIAYLEFTSGGIVEVFEDDTIIGQTSGATALVSTVILEKGTWAGGDAAGKLGVLEQYGIFTAGEAVRIKQNLNVLTVKADSIGAVDAGGGQVWLPLTNHGLRVSPDQDWIIIDGSRYYDGTHVIQAIEADRFKIDATYKAEKFTGEEDVYVGLPNGKDISLVHEGTDDDGYYDGVLPDTISGLEEDESYYLFVKFVKDGTQTMARVYWKATFYPDEL